MENVLEINNLRKQYGSITAVSKLKLEIPRGSVFGILGPNGSGKTTTLGMVLGVTRPTSGDYSWFGKPTINFSVKQGVGAILETPNFYPYLNAIENLKIVAQIKEIKEPNLERVLKKVNLHNRSHSKFKTYSLGMKQRLAIASALLCNPEVLVLDEPTNGLDPQGIAEIRQLIRDIANEGITVIMASHLLDEIEKVCSHVAVLRHGELLYTGTVEEMMGQDGVIQVDAANREELKNVLLKFPGVDHIKDEATYLSLILNTEVSSEQLNKYLTENGIYASHLVFRKNTLEEKFLNLVKDQA